MNLPLTTAQTLIAAFRANHPDAVEAVSITEDEAKALINARGNGIRAYFGQREDGRLTLVFTPNRGGDIMTPAAEAETAIALDVETRAGNPPVVGGPDHPPY